jgi:hypothetical protein
MKFVFDIKAGERVDFALCCDIRMIDFFIKQCEESPDDMSQIINMLKLYKKRCKYKQTAYILFSDNGIKSITPLIEYLASHKPFIDETEFKFD